MGADALGPRRPAAYGTYRAIVSPVPGRKPREGVQFMLNLKVTGAPFILLSGGIDSTALLSQLVFEENTRPRGFFLDVGQ